MLECSLKEFAVWFGFQMPVGQLKVLPHDTGSEGVALGLWLPV